MFFLLFPVVYAGIPQTANCVSGRIHFNSDRIAFLSNDTVLADPNRYDMTIDYGASNVIVYIPFGPHFLVESQGCYSVVAQESNGWSNCFWHSNVFYSLFSLWKNYC